MVQNMTCALRCLGLCATDFLLIGSLSFGCCTTGLQQPPYTGETHSFSSWYTPPPSRDASPYARALEMSPRLAQESFAVWYSLPHNTERLLPRVMYLSSLSVCPSTAAYWQERWRYSPSGL